MSQHVLDARRENLHGPWSRELPPVLEINPGDSVAFTTLDAMWCDGRPTDTPWKRIAPLPGRRDDGHALTGPVFIRGAQPGMTLAIRIGALVPGDWAWTWSWPSIGRVRELGLAGLPNAMRMWNLDPERMEASDEQGRTMKLRPFMGVIGVAPPEPGEHSTTPPRIWGGNIDCKELTSGTTLYLPIGVEGALFSVGDGHGAQGDGEVCGTAIECPMKRVELTFDPVDAPAPLKAPRAKTADAWLTFGFDEDLNRAMLMALNGMLDLIQEQRAVDRQEALLLASLAVDLRITQIVNRAQGVHAVLPIDAIAGSG